ncbi:MAG: hypothetical protein H6Q17_2680 [Bacteroidetes bacterium]|nr:hypothetical protein [Bacteroidota bacterium]
MVFDIKYIQYEILNLEIKMHYYTFAAFFGIKRIKKSEF